MQRVLITGATGFTGRYLAPVLAKRGYEVHGTVHGEAGSQADATTRLHALDIGDARAVETLIRDVAPDKVVHLAAIAFVAHSDVAEMYRTNVLGTRNLLAALADAPSGPSAILLASSANIYGNARAGILDEATPVSPANDYGVTKAALELLGGVYGDRLPTIIVRPFNYTGRGQSRQFLIPKIVEHFRDGKAEIELGNVDVERDFSDVRAVVDAYARLLDEPRALGGTFNVCSGRATSLDEILELVSGITGQRLNVRVNPDFVRADEVKTLRGSPERLESLIGPMTNPPLEETLRWMVEDRGA